MVVQACVVVNRLSSIESYTESFYIQLTVLNSWLISITLF